MKRVLAIGGVVASLLLLPFATADAAVAAPSAAAQSVDVTCKELGRTDVPSKDPDYRTDLDRDGDGVACEENEGAAPVANEPNRGADGTSSSSGSASSSSGSTSSSSTGDDDGDDDQVTVVPDGGAPTGDGSTDGSSAPYWVAGGLVALLAAAGVTLRKRIFTRS